MAQANDKANWQYQCRQASTTRFPSLDSCELYRARAAEGKPAYKVCLGCPGPESYEDKPADDEPGASMPLSCKSCGAKMPVSLNARGKAFLHCAQCRARRDASQARYKQKKKGAVQAALPNPSNAAELVAIPGYTPAPAPPPLDRQSQQWDAHSLPGAPLPESASDKHSGTRPEISSLMSELEEIERKRALRENCRVCGQPALAGGHLSLRLSASDQGNALSLNFFLPLCGKYACISQSADKIMRTLEGNDGQASL